MLSSIKRLWRQNRLLLLAFSLAATLTILFAVRMVLFGIYWGNPDHQNQPLEGWMTPRYIAYSYGLERDDVRKILGFDPVPVAREHLDILLKDQDIKLGDLQRRLDAFVATQASQ